MMVHVVMSAIFFYGLLIFGNTGQKVLGTGKWSVLNAQPCARDEEMPWWLRVRRHKANRTHDGFDLDFKVVDGIDDSISARVDICKMVDGGCKPFMAEKEECLPELLNKYAPENVKGVLTAAGLNPPEFPVPKGELHVDNYILNLEELPEDGLYGEFGVDTYFVKGGVDVACVRLSLKYEAVDDDDMRSRYG